MRSRARGVFLSFAVVAAAACDRGPELEVRTFDLDHIQADEAAEIIEPYVFADREEAPGHVSLASRTLTVRETPDNLDRIERVLAEHDRPRPGVVLHFRIIEADGAAAPDSAIADVVAQLERLFRYDGYRQAGEAVILANPGSAQTFRAGPNYGVSSRVVDVYTGGGSSTVELNVEMGVLGLGTVLETSVKAPIGQTVVLGTTRPEEQRGALILTVRSELQGS